jgi:bacterioferritin-associated ferredoxin
MNPGMASDEVTDAIALIEMQRQYMAKETGLAAACSEALRKLHELLAAEQAAPPPYGPGTGHLANTEAVMIEIKRVTKLAGSASQSAMSKRARPGQQQPMPHPRGPRNVPRNKGRRTMGRRGDR